MNSVVSLVGHFQSDITCVIINVEVKGKGVFFYLKNSDLPSSHHGYTKEPSRKGEYLCPIHMSGERFPTSIN